MFSWVNSNVNFNMFTVESQVGFWLQHVGTPTIDLSWGRETTEKTENYLKTGHPSVDSWVSWWFMQCTSKPIFANTVFLTKLKLFCYGTITAADLTATCSCTQKKNNWHMNGVANLKFYNTGSTISSPPYQ